MIDAKVFVISMAGSTERRNRFSRNADDSGIEWQFFDAHTQLAADLIYDEQAAIANHGRPLSAGELGCYSSHYSVWQEFLTTGGEQCIVFEDDVVVDWAGVSLLSNINLGHHDIGYLRLYHKRPGRMQVLASDFSRRSLHIVELFDKAYGTQGYIICRDVAKLFCESFTNVVRPIDDQMDRYFEHGVRNLSVYPFLLFEESVPSEIGTSRFSQEKSAPAVRRRSRSDKRERNRAFRKYRAKHLLTKIYNRLGLNRRT